MATVSARGKALRLKYMPTMLKICAAVRQINNFTVVRDSDLIWAMLRLCHNISGPMSTNCMAYRTNSKVIIVTDAVNIFKSASANGMTVLKANMNPMPSRTLSSLAI